EVYDNGRYFTVTGSTIGRTVVADIQVQLDELAARHAAPAASAERGEIPSAIDDEKLIHQATAATNGAKFLKLWNGDTSDFDGDESRADLALCGMLAFWTHGDAARIDRLFRQSGLMREKWNEKRGSTTYGSMTIATALNGKTEFYKLEPAPAGRVRLET